MKKQMLLVAILALSTTTVLPMENNNNNDNKNLDDKNQEQQLERQQKQKEENKSSEGSFLRRFLWFGPNAVSSSLAKNKENNKEEKEDKKEKEEKQQKEEEDQAPEPLVLHQMFVSDPDKDGIVTVSKSEDKKDGFGLFTEVQRDDEGLFFPTLDNARVVSLEDLQSLKKAQGVEENFKALQRRSSTAANGYKSEMEKAQGNFDKVKKELDEKNTTILDLRKKLKDAQVEDDGFSSDKEEEVSDNE